MEKQILKNKFLIVIVIFLALSLSYSNVFAWDGHGHGGGGHGHYYYRGGRWYNDRWFWGGFASGLAIGTVVATLPPYYGTVYVGSAPYYYYDNIYYRPYSTGYIVVPAPATNAVVAEPAAVPVVAAPTVAAPTVTQPKVASSQGIVINIPNASGGYTPVTLTKHKTGYIGPQGEYYEGHPNVEQLRVLYGK